MDISLSGRLIEIRYRDVDMPTPEFIAAAKEAGFDGVELRSTQLPAAPDGDAVGAIAAALAEHAMRLTRVLGGKVNADTWDAFAATVQTARALNAETLGIWVVDEEWTRKACDLTAEHDLAIVLQTHSGPHIGTPEDSLRFMEAVGRPNLKLMYDPSHFYAARKPYGPEAIEMLAPHIHCGGFQKYFAETDAAGKLRTPRVEWDAEIGVQFPPVIEGFRAIGMDNHITCIEPHTDGQDSPERMAHYAAALRSLLG